MKELESIIYFDICLFAIEKYQSTSYISYLNKVRNFHYYCVCVKSAIMQENFSRVYTEVITEISKKIELIYALTKDDSIHYITNFFLDEKYINYAEAALAIKHYFPNSFL